MESTRKFIPKLTVILLISFLGRSSYAQYVVPTEHDLFIIGTAGADLAAGVHLSSMTVNVDKGFQQYSWGENMLRTELTDGKMTSLYIDKKEYGSHAIEKFGYDIGGGLGSATRCAINSQNKYLNLVRSGKAECVTVTSSLCQALKSNFSGKSISDASNEIRQCSQLFSPLENMRKAMDQDSYKLVAKADRDYIFSHSNGGMENFSALNFPNIYSKSKTEESIDHDPKAFVQAFGAMNTLLDNCSNYYPNLDAPSRYAPKAVGGSGTIIK